MNSEDAIDDVEGNYSLFRDCVFEAVVNKSSSTTTRRKKLNSRRRALQSVNRATAGKDVPATHSDEAIKQDPAELAEFSDYLAAEVFPAFPDTLRLIDHTTLKPTTTSDMAVEDADNYSLPLTISVLEALTCLVPPTVADTLQAYGLISPPATDTGTFLSPILTAYITSATRPPPAPSATRTTACELCSRDWIPLTYHHLIPKQIHTKALKRGWHDEAKLNSVAWLCRACHSFVHRVASNEELAREYYTVEKLSEREDVEKWVGWVGGVRWKKR
jgi:hypothetical protein